MDALKFFEVLRLVIFIFLAVIFQNAIAQKGYVKSSNDSIFKGLIKYDFDLYNPEKGVKIKVYSSKKDKQPLIFYELEVFEHGVKDDRYMNLFYVYPDKNNPEELFPFLKTKIINSTRKYTLASYYLDGEGGFLSSTFNPTTGTPTPHYYVDKEIYYILVDNYSREIVRMFEKKKEVVKFLSAYVKDKSVLNQCSNKRNKEKDMVLLMDTIKKERDIK